VAEGFLRCFAGPWKGVLRKAGVWVWFFAGKNVVKCVVNVAD
jgi:hypothetical protein